jgi:hypothetical protein
MSDDDKPKPTLLHFALIIFVAMSMVLGNLAYLKHSALRDCNARVEQLEKELRQLRALQNDPKPPN